MARKVKLQTSLGNVREHTLQVFEEIAAKWPIYFAWGIGPSGEHAEGRALDFMGFEGGTVQKPGPIDSKKLREIADYLWAHRKRLGVWYVIYNRQIISMTYESQGWRKYNGSNPHVDHVHVSFYNGVTYKPPSGTGSGGASGSGAGEEVDAKTIDQIADKVTAKLLGKQIEFTSGEQKRYKDYPESLSVRSLLVHGGGESRELARMEALRYDALLANVQQNEQYIKRVEGKVDAISGALAAAVAQAVRDALADGVIRVDINVRGGNDEA